MAQVTTVRKVQTHQTTVRWHQCLVDLQVGWAATQGLYVDTPLGRVDVEGLESTLLAQELDLVNVLIATIVAGTRLALGVLVGHGRAKSVEDSTGGDILGGDEDDGLPLALDLIGLARKEVLSATVAGSVVEGWALECTHHDLSDLRVGLEKRLLEHL